jgi:hypothetical protein
MNAPSERDVKILLARSMNHCAYPNCSSLIVQPTGTITGEICHIKARSKKWPRYDETQTDEQRHAYENLILLCRNHHKIVDAEPEKYTVELLKEIKQMQEKHGGVELTQDDVLLVRKLMDSYLQIHAEEDAQSIINSPNANQVNKSTKSRKTIRQTVIGDGNYVAGGNLIHTEKVVQKNVTQPVPQHITEEQAYEVKTMIDELAQIDVDSGREDSHRTWYSWLYRKFKVTSYKTIPIEKYEDVISWLRQQKAINRKKLRRPANDTWKNQLYRSIFARWRQLGHEKEAIYDFAFRRLGLGAPIGSLKELGEQDLKRLYDIVIRIR